MYLHKDREPFIKHDEDFAVLIREVREHRSKLRICPSAQEHIVISNVILEFCDNDFYKEDYQAITSYFAADYVPYEEVIKNMRELAKKQMVWVSIGQ